MSKCCCSRINDDNNTHDEMNARRRKKNWRTNAQEEFEKLNQPENDIVTQSVLAAARPGQAKPNRNGNGNEIEALFEAFA